MAETKKPEELNIYQKLAKIRKPAEAIKKNKQGYGYTYVTEDEILSKISGGMEKYNVSLIPQIVPETLKVTPYHYLKTKSSRSGEIYEEHCNEMLIQAEMRWIWVNNDNPEEKVIVPWALVGQQSEASQCFGSALTYSSRYFMLKYFNIATSDDDPEVFRTKKKEAEMAEERALLEGVLNNIDTKVKGLIESTPDERDNIIKLIKKYKKNANYFEIKDVETAKGLLTELIAQYPTDKEE